MKSNQPWEQQQQPLVQSFQLKGHSGSVLCLDHSNNSTRCCSPSGDSTLLSGSEDGTCRLWDLRTGIRATLCIRCCKDRRDVLSVAFGPNWTQGLTNCTVSTTSRLARDYSVYVAVENKVHEYDLRSIDSPIITQSVTDCSLLDCPDEVNQITFSPFLGSRIDHSKQRSNKWNDGRQSSNHTNEATKYLFAAADDSGTISVTHSLEKSNDCKQSTIRVLSHGNTALVTSIAFCPRTNGKHVLLASGGTDCCIHLWNVGYATGKPKNSVPICSVSIPQPLSSATTTNRICNPPMVHCLQWSPSGSILSAGLGDGSVALMHQSNASLILSTRIQDAHSDTVAACIFPAWTSAQNITPNNAIVANDRLLCTAGNDGCIVLWDLGVTTCGEQADNPTSLFTLRSNDVCKTMGDLRVSNKDTSTGLVVDEPQTLFAVQHPYKPNWMVNSGCDDTTFPHTLFIADTSHNVTAYTIPIR
jgi:WD repeat-containing protein 53